MKFLVHELRGRIGGVALLHGALECALVPRLQQRDRVVRPREVEHHDVELRTQCGLEVTLPVEPLLGQLLLDRIDGLLLVRELARELVDRLPLGGGRVGVDGDEQRRGSRDDARSITGAPIRRAAAARERERKQGEQSSEPEDYQIVSLASRLLVEAESTVPNATSVPNFSSFTVVDGLVWLFPVNEASACRIGASR